MLAFLHQNKFRIASLSLAFLLAVPPTASALDPNHDIDKVNKDQQGGPKKKNFADCNWLVTYRGRTYDLIPLTKQSLTAPLDDDIREVMERYPESKEHLELMSKYSHAAKVHTLFASGALAGAVLSTIMRSRAKNVDDRNSATVVIFTFGAFFLKGIDESWRATDSAKDELTEAVRAFNTVSPHPIEPAGVNNDALEGIK